MIQADYYFRSGDAKRCLVIGAETFPGWWMIMTGGEYAMLLEMDKSHDRQKDEENIFIKMNGRRVYKFSLNFVPTVIKRSLDKAGLHITDVKKVLIHQAMKKWTRRISTQAISCFLRRLELA